MVDVIFSDYSSIQSHFSESAVNNSDVAAERSFCLLPVTMSSPLTSMHWAYPKSCSNIADGLVILLVVPRSPARKFHLSRHDPQPDVTTTKENDRDAVMISESSELEMDTGTGPVLTGFDSTKEVLAVMKYFSPETLSLLMLGPVIIPRDRPIAYHKYVH